MGASVDYLWQDKGGGLYFRREYPVPLRPYVPGGGQQLKRSMKARAITAPGFAERFAVAGREYEQNLALARKAASRTFDPLDREKVMRLKAIDLGKRLAADQDIRDGMTRDARSPRERAEQHEADALGFSDIYDAHDPQATVSLFAEQAAVLASREVWYVGQSAPEFALLCAELLRNRIEVANEQIARDRGGHVATPVSLAALPALARPVVAKSDGDAALMRLFDDFIAERKPAESTVITWRPYMRHLIAYLGHDDATRVTPRDLTRWKDALQRETSTKGKPFAAGTIAKGFLPAIKAVLSWAFDNERIDANPATKLRMRTPTPVKLRDKGFTDMEALTILRATLATPTENLSREKALARRWVPWLLAYTGARVGEIGQLRREDVEQIDGRWTIRITPEAGTVKTSTARMVPLHPHLVELGFVDVVKASATDRLFYDPTLQRKDAEHSRQAAKVGEALAAWVRSIGITDSSISPNHAWRHRFKTVARDCGMDQGATDAIQGHAPATEGRKYGTYPIAFLFRELSKLPRMVIDGGAVKTSLEQLAP